MKREKPSGAVFFHGRSTIDGSTIVGIVTFQSRNEKTGNMAQTWILREDSHPVDAIHNGADRSICGNCPLRGIIETQNPGDFDTRNRFRGCYVNVSNAPAQVWRAYTRGSYPALDLRLSSHRNALTNRPLRLGAYGDPVAIPLKAWRRLQNVCGKHQPGYTHQWWDCDQEWRNYIMASCHSVDEMEVANYRGWRTFRTRTANQPLAQTEIACPASLEGGFSRACATCGACNGGNPNKRSIAIVAHGSPATLAGVNRVIGGAL